MSRHLFALLPLTAFALIPACARQPANPPAPEAPAVVIVGPSGSMTVEPDVAPPPRLIPPAAEAVNDPADSTLAFEGRKLFLKLQCIQCHSATPNAKGPALEGLYGSKVSLKGGGAVVADEQYLLESIRRPKAKVVEGWEAIMPDYGKELVTEEEALALVAYIRSLKRGGAKSKEEQFPAPVGPPTERINPLRPPGDQPRLEPLKLREVEVAPPPREK